jgi:hypothetical protein
VISGSMIEAVVVVVVVMVVRSIAPRSDPAIQGQGQRGSPPARQGHRTESVRP